MTLECRQVFGNHSADLSGSIVIQNPDNQEPEPANDRFSFASPIVERVYLYWCSKCQQDALPSRSDIEPSEIPDLLPHVILLDVQEDPRDYRYRLIGTGITKHLERDLTGAWMSEIPFQMPPSTIWDNCSEVANTRRPKKSKILYVGPFQEFLQAEDIIMPLADETGRVNMLFVFVAYISKYDPS